MTESILLNALKAIADFSEVCDKACWVEHIKEIAKAAIKNYEEENYPKDAAIVIDEKGLHNLHDFKQCKDEPEEAKIPLHHHIENNKCVRCGCDSYEVYNKNCYEPTKETLSTFDKQMGNPLEQLDDLVKTTT